MTAQGSPVTIRDETPGDHATIGAVLTAAFGQAAEARLVSQLRSGGSLRLSLVAEIERRVVGHVAFSPVAVEGSSGAAPGLGLAPEPGALVRHGREFAAAGIDAGPPHRGGG
jgi:putative acetyltransferase